MENTSQISIKIRAVIKLMKNLAQFCWLLVVLEVLKVLEVLEVLVPIERMLMSTQLGVVPKIVLAHATCLIVVLNDLTIAAANQDISSSNGCRPSSP